jgi:CRP-like cAMP-binding protein
MIKDGPEEQPLLLTDVDILKELPQGEVEYVAARSRVVYLGKRESIALGEDPRGILLVVRGRVRVHEPSSIGPDLTFYVVKGGAVVGQTGSTPRPSLVLRVETLEPSVLRVVAWEDFEALVLRNPKWGRRLFASLSSGWPSARVGFRTRSVRKCSPAWRASSSDSANPGASALARAAVGY